MRVPSKHEQTLIRIFTYSERGGASPILPFLNQFENILTTSIGTASAILAGLSYGIMAGIISGIVTIIIILLVIKIIKLIVGWMDLNVMGWTAYQNHWLSGIAPIRVNILDYNKKEVVKCQ